MPTPPETSGTPGRMIAGTATATAQAESVALRHETWWSWFPNASLDDALTLEELLDEVNTSSRMPPVTRDRLSNWQKAGIVPFPIRRQVQAGRGGVRALFPRAAVEVLIDLVLMQGQGVPLGEIGPRLRGTAALMYYPDPNELYDRVAAVADRHAELTGRHIESVELRFTDANGNQETYSYPIRTNQTVKN